jgi:hypothetical protein
MNRTLLAIVALCVASASAAQDVKPSSQDARASMPYLGTAAMSDDGTLSLHLRSTSDGKPAGDTLTYKITDRAYDNVLRHLGGVNPGGTKEFRPWKD